MIAIPRIFWFLSCSTLLACACSTDPRDPILHEFHSLNDSLEMITHETRFGKGRIEELAASIRSDCSKNAATADSVLENIRALDALLDSTKTAMMLSIKSTGDASRMHRMLSVNGLGVRIFAAITRHYEVSAIAARTPQAVARIDEFHRLAMPMTDAISWQETNFKGAPAATYMAVLSKTSMDAEFAASMSLEAISLRCAGR